MTGSKSVTVNNCTATRQGLEESELMEGDWAVIAPNPVVEQVLTLQVRGVEGQEVRWALVTLQGVVLQQDCFESHSRLHRQALPVGGSKAGMYVLRVETETSKANLKVVKVE